MSTAGGFPLGLGLNFNKFKKASASQLNPPPVNSVLPVISSNTTFMEPAATITTTNGTWSNSPTGYTYQWTLNGSDIIGATNNTYVPINGDSGGTLACRVTAANAGGTGSASSAGSSVLNRRQVPTDIAALIAWFDLGTDVNGVVQAGGYISQLNDLSTTASHVIQNTGANQPAYDANDFNGYPAALFNGNQFLLASGLTGINGANGYTFGINVIPYNISAAGRIYAGANNSNADTAAGALRCYKESAQSQIKVDGGSGSLVNAVTLGNPILLIGQRNPSATLKSWVDGGSAQTGTPQSGTLSFNRLCLGTNLIASSLTGTTFFNGAINLFTLFNSVLGTTDQQILEGIMAWRSGRQASLAVSHPYISVPPRI